MHRNGKLAIHNTIGTTNEERNSTAKTDERNMDKEKEEKEKDKALQMEEETEEYTDDDNGNKN